MLGDIRGRSRRFQERGAGLVGGRLRFLVHALFLQLRLNIGLDFVKRLYTGGLSFENLNDVIPVLGGDDIAGLFGLGGESKFFKFRNGLAAHDETQVAAVLRRSRILRVLFREFGEVRAAFNLLQ